MKRLMGYSFFMVGFGMFFMFIIPSDVIGKQFPVKEQRMCQGTFSRLRRSLATTTLYAAVCILAERFYFTGNCFPVK